jgi:alkylation response protein AidB-like acyl-CoA dehydrogenase
VTEPDTAESVLAIATELGAVAHARWEELDSGCRVPGDLYEAALRAGLFRSLVPAEMGGSGLCPLDWVRIGVELARHDASLGWVITQGAVELGWIATAGTRSGLPTS